MNDASHGIPNILILPVAVCFLVGKIMTFPAYVVCRIVKASWELFYLGDLWRDWYSRT